ncbi:MAG: hypothetical protein J4F40_18645 [Alphaproteobacteria bacterium]|nr:hypothetical protein [Alphaproteobacteria bacterium]
MNQNGETASSHLITTAGEILYDSDLEAVIEYGCNECDVDLDYIPLPDASARIPSIVRLYAKAEHHAAVSGHQTCLNATLLWELDRDTAQPVRIVNPLTFTLALLHAVNPRSPKGNPYCHPAELGEGVVVVDAWVLSHLFESPSFPEYVFCTRCTERAVDEF